MRKVMSEYLASYHKLKNCHSNKVSAKGRNTYAWQKMGLVSIENQVWTIIREDMVW